MGKVHAARQGLHKGSVPLNHFYAADSEAGFNVTPPGPEDEPGRTRFSRFWRRSGGIYRTEAPADRSFHPRNDGHNWLTQTSEGISAPQTWTPPPREPILILAPGSNLYKAVPGHSLLYWFTGPAAVGLEGWAGSGSNAPADDT